jgi:predicted nucleic acid-binding protein
MKIFIDTSAFIALIDTSDKNHNTAKQFFDGAVKNGTRFFTSNYVVCETLNYLRAKISHEIAVMFFENIKKSRIIEVKPITNSNEEQAFMIFRDYTDKDFSFTDCTSFALMRAISINHAFAFDRHFAQVRDFRKLP